MITSSHTPVLVGCCGAFDYLLHDGHRTFLQFVRSKGNTVTVFVAADTTIKRNKRRDPHFDQQTRANHLIESNLADSTVLLDGDDSKDIEIITESGISAYVFGSDQNSLWNQRLVAGLTTRAIPYFRAPSSTPTRTSDLLAAIQHPEESDDS